MFKKIKKSYYTTGAAITIGMLQASSAEAAGNNLGSIAVNINASMASLPGLIAAISYLFGVLLAVLGILKIKDHVENPTQSPLKDGAIRLAAGGALFALPIILEAMSETIDSGGGGTAVSTSKLRATDNTVI